MIAEKVFGYNELAIKNEMKCAKCDMNTTPGEGEREPKLYVGFTNRGNVVGPLCVLCVGGQRVTEETEQDES